MTTIDEARDAKKEVSRILTHCFNGLVGSIGIGAPDEETGVGYHVAVRLHREPTEDEHSRLIHDYKSVPVRYRVTGSTTPQ